LKIIFSIFLKKLKINYIKYKELVNIINNKNDKICNK
jgi:hypothetical protein